MTSHPAPGTPSQRPGVNFFVWGACSAALAFYSSYFLSAWLFSAFEVTQNVSWIFLPAVIRMLAVLLAGWAGVVGLFVGAVLVNSPTLLTDTAHVLTLGILSSVPSLYAAQAVQRVLRIPSTLAGMSGRHLMYFGITGGLFNSTAHTLYFTLRAESLQPLDGFVPMFVGDTIGTFLVLYTGAFLLRRVRLPAR